MERVQALGAGQLRGSQSLNADECALWRQPDWCDMPSLELIEFAMSLSARELSQLKEIVALAQGLIDKAEAASADQMKASG